MTASDKELALTREQILEILDIRIPENEFYWLVSTNNRAKIGSKAGCLHKNGYTRIRVNGNYFYAHRLVWFVTYGVFPNGVIDHVDGDKSNDRIENLRDATMRVNMQNKKRYERVDDLPTGVCAHRNKFRVIIAYYAYWQDMDGERCFTYFGLKQWSTPEAALAAAVVRREVEITNLLSLGAAYTERHGAERSN